MCPDMSGFRFILRHCDARNAAKPQRLKVKGSRQKESGSRFQVPDFPNPIFDMALSRLP